MANRQGVPTGRPALERRSNMRRIHRLQIAALLLFVTLCAVVALRSPATLAQMPDRTRTGNVANFGIAKSLSDEIGAGRGSWTTPGSSSFIIARDPFRAIRRGRQLFQRKFLRSQGQGPL